MNLETFVAEELNDSKKIWRQLEDALRTYSFSLQLPRPESVTSRVARVLALVEGAHLWHSLARPDLAQAAAAAARQLAAELGPPAEHLEPALRAPVAYRKEVVHDQGPDESFLDDRPSRAGANTVAFQRITGQSAAALAPDPARPWGATRRIKMSALWWTGYQTAYLDLLYNHLPAQLLARQQQGAAAYRLWNVGCEDGSQTFFLAALLADAQRQLVARQAASQPDFPLEVIGTDFARWPNWYDRSIHFAITEAPMTTKMPLLVEEIGPGELSRAERAVRRLERKLRGATGERGEQLLDCLADAGKGGLLMRTLLAPDLAVYLPVGGRRPELSYSLTHGSWRVEDNKLRLEFNPEVAGRLIRFELGDVTLNRPAGLFDLVVCTNVLPYLSTYEDSKQSPSHKAKLVIALEHLEQSLAPGGKLVVDVGSERFIAQSHPEYPSRLRDAGKLLLVTRGARLDPL